MKAKNKPKIINNFIVLFTEYCQLWIFIGLNGFELWLKTRALRKFQRFTSPCLILYLRNSEPLNRLYATPQSCWDRKGYLFCRPVLLGKLNCLESKIYGYELGRHRDGRFDSTFVNYFFIINPQRKNDAAGCVSLTHLSVCGIHSSRTDELI